MRPHHGLVAAFCLVSATARAQSAPMQCFVNSLPTVARAAGHAELVGDLVITCAGGTPTAAGATTPTVNVSVTLSTPITSRLHGAAPTGTWTEALLFLDDPAPGAQFPCEPADGQLSCPALGSGTGVTTYAADGNRNVFRGLRGNQGQTLNFVAIPLDPPGDEFRVLRIKNIRAAIAGVSAANGQVVAFVSFSGSSVPALNNPSVNVAFVQNAVNVTFPDKESVVSGVAATRHRLTNIRIVEGFASALRGRTPAMPPDPPDAQDSVANYYDTETGFFAPGLFAAAPDLGLADTGTLLEIKVIGVPPGLTLEVGPPTSPNGAFSARPYGVVADADGFVAVPIVAGTGVVRWEVTGANPGMMETITVPVYESHPAASVFPRTTFVIQVGLGAVDTTATASATAPLPRFAESPFQTAFTLPGHAPVADAGPDQVVTEGALITLDGTGSYDLDGDTLSYHWAIVDPIAFELGFDAIVSGPAAATDEFGQLYLVELTVSDRDGADSDTMIVRVDNHGGTCEQQPPARCATDFAAYVYIAIETNRGPRFAACWTDFGATEAPTLHCAEDGQGALELTHGEPLCTGD